MSNKHHKSVPLTRPIQSDKGYKKSLNEIGKLRPAPKESGGSSSGQSSDSGKGNTSSSSDSGGSK